MREGTATIVRRQDYQAPAFWIRSVELSFDLDPAKTIVTNRMRIERNPAVAPQPLALHGESITVLRVMADGQSVSFREEGGLLHIDDLPLDKTAFDLEIRNTCAPVKNTELSGLYVSGGGFYTQCEAQGFRRITYFLDRPDVMAVYTVTLRADKKKYPVLLANGNLVEQGDLENGRHFAVWRDPHPKPSYLFALVASDLVAREQRIRTRLGNQHLLQIWVRRGDLDRTGHAMNSLMAAVAWDEARFNLPLDLERFMIVAVDDFNMGAMENKGLNLFNSRYVLASPASATDLDYADIESIVGHEYFHNWTGNRVTCRDWFQLSLKEGLTVFRDQQFSMDMAAAESAASPESARAVRRIDDVRRLRTIQFPEDAGPMAHPVRPDAYMAIDNFYTATVYEKGAEVVRMMHTLVGEQGFARGMALYFQRHDGQAVTCDDFAQAIADANPDSPLAAKLETFKRWYSQSGTPRLIARGRYDAPSRSYILGLEQQCAATPGQPTKLPFVIPVQMGLLDRQGHALPLRLEGDSSAPMQRLLVLDEHRAFYTFTDIDAEPVLSLLQGFSAPVTLVDGLGDAELLIQMQHDTDAFNRWEAAQRLTAARLRAAIEAPAGTLAGAPVLDEAYIKAMQHVIRHPSLDPALKAMVVMLPSEAWTAEGSSEAEPQRIHAAHEAVRRDLAASLQADWAWVVNTYSVREGYRPSPDQAGRRALANVALEFCACMPCASGDEIWQGRIYQRFKDAGNMTDRLGALEALLNAGSRPGRSGARTLPRAGRA